MWAWRMRGSWIKLGLQGELSCKEDYQSELSWQGSRWACWRARRIILYTQSQSNGQLNSVRSELMRSELMKDRRCWISVHCKCMQHVTHS